MCLLSVVYIVVMSFDTCTAYRKEILPYDKQILNCFDKNYKMGCIVSTESIKRYYETRIDEVLPNKYYRYPINDKETFLFKSYKYYKLYDKMCQKLKLNDRNSKNVSVLSDILIFFFEGVCVFYIASVASCYDKYDETLNRIVKMIEEGTLRNKYHKQAFINTLMEEMYVQRMDVRYVFEQITDVCWKLYGHMDRQELFDPRATFCKNVLLGLKLRPCGISSPLKFKGSKFVDELLVSDFNGDFTMEGVRRESDVRNPLVENESKSEDGVQRYYSEEEKTESRRQSRK